MADDQKQKYPNMASNNWWALRKKFLISLPAKVTTSYLASALDMSEHSAKKNILPTLRITGIIDEDGKPSERAVKWRDNAQYAQVCEEIRKEVFPQEVLDLAPHADFDRAAVQRWFANHLRIGQDAARRIAAFYAILTEAEPTKEGANTSTKSKVVDKAKQPQRKPSRSTEDVNSQIEPPEAANRSQRTTEPIKQSPAVHINVQIHISPESSAEQIDLIFASMAKHLKDLS